MIKVNLSVSKKKKSVSLSVYENSSLMYHYLIQVYFCIILVYENS